MTVTNYDYVRYGIVAILRDTFDMTMAETVFADDRETGAADRIYIDAVLSGDDEAFNALVRRYKRKVFSISARFARDKHELDDICQEAFIKAFQMLGKYRAEAPFEHWLSKITINCCYDALRKQKTRAGDIPLEDAGELTASVSHDKEESYRELYRALDRLSPKDKMVIVLLELEEKSVREVSQLTGWSETNVKVRAFRARWKLRRCLEGSDEKQEA